MERPIHLAVALDGAGWHPAAWRLPNARPTELLTAGYWSDLLGTAERGVLDFATIHDSLTIQSSSRTGPDERVDQVRGRLDAVLTAARIAPGSSGIGVVPAISTTHTEPFHISKAIATLDYVSTGRAGVQIRVGDLGGEAALFGRREPADFRSSGVDAQVRADLFDEAADYVEVVRRLWDSWQDDAEIRDVATGRFIDRERLHYIDFEGRWFSVRGPSITPRPPQGQPLVTALAHASVVYRFAAQQADVVFVTPQDSAQATSILTEVWSEAEAAGRAGELKVFADLEVLLADTDAAAEARRTQLEDWAGAEWRSDARIFTGTATGLAEELLELHSLGYDGFRLRPAALPDDLTAIAEQLVPELQRRGLFHDGYTASTLRGALGLPRPANRYETVGA